MIPSSTLVVNTNGHDDKNVCVAHLNSSSVMRRVSIACISFALSTWLMLKQSESAIDDPGLEIRGSKCYHVFSFATGMLMW